MLPIKNMTGTNSGNAVIGVGFYYLLHRDICYLSVLRRKDESQNGGNQETKHAKFSEKRPVFTPWYTHVHEVLCFLVTSVSRFALLPYCQPYVTRRMRCLSLMSGGWHRLSFWIPVEGNSHKWFCWYLQSA